MTKKPRKKAKPKMVFAPWIEEYDDLDHQTEADHKRAGQGIKAWAAEQKHKEPPQR